MKPFISIIVPIYNVANYIIECVDSILKQRMNDIELILVDDGSTDKSGLICDEYGKNTSKVTVIHQINGGLSDARNTGIKAANGKYILFIDGDDYVAADCLESIIETCKKQNQPDVVFLKAYKKYNSGKTEQLDDDINETKVVGVPKMEVLIYIASLKKYPASAWTKLVKKELFETNNLYFEHDVKSEDLDWTKRLLFAANTFGCCSTDYYYYRQFRQGSISNSLSYKNFKDIINVLDSWIEEADTLNTDKKKVLLSFAAYEYKVLLSVYKAVDGANRRNAKIWLQKHKKILMYRNDQQIVIIRSVMKVIGLENTTRLLNIYLKCRS